MFSEHVEIAFVNFSVFFLAKVGNYSNHNPTKTNRSSSGGYFLSKSSTELIESSFDNFAKRNFQKSKKFSLEVQIYIKTKKFVKNLFLQFVSWTRRELFWQPFCRSFTGSQKQLRSKFGSQTKKIFSKKVWYYFSCNCTPWTRRKQFRKLYG